MNRIFMKKLFLGVAASMVMTGLAVVLTVGMQPNENQTKLFEQLKADFSFTVDSGHALLDVDNEQVVTTVLDEAPMLERVSAPITVKPMSSPQPAQFPESAVYAMGQNTSGQLGIGTGLDTNVPVQVGASNQWGGPLAVGPYHMLVSDSSSLLWTSGDDISGQFGNGPTNSSTTAIIFSESPPYTTIKSVAVGNSHSLVVMDDGKVMAAGEGSLGQLGDGLSADTNVFVAIMDDGVEVAALYNNSFILKKNGSLWAFGQNDAGQLGTGDAVLRTSPVEVDPAGVVSVSVGTTHTIYLMDDGAVFAMGYNSYGQFGDGTTDSSFSPVMVIPSGVKQIAAGNGFSLFRMEDGSLQGVGLNSDGQLGTGDTAIQSALVTIIADSVSDIAAGNSHTMFAKDDGTLWGIGGNSNGQLGTSDFSPRLNPTQVPGAANVAAVTAGFNSTFYQTRTLTGLVIEGLSHIYDGSKVNYECHAQWSDGRVTKVTAEAVWMEDSPYTIFRQNTGVLEAMPGASGMITITVSYQGMQTNRDIHVRDLPLGSALWGHGDNAFSQLGLDTVVDMPSPMSVDTSKVISMAAGIGHSLYVTEIGEVFAAGNNTYGQLGTGDTIPRTTPFQIMVGGAHSVACGDDHSFIVMRDGSLWGFGRNDDGQLGDGTPFHRNYPTEIWHAGVEMVDAGSHHSVFLKNDGSVWTMGNNTSGQLGTGDYAPWDKPYLVMSAPAGVNYVAAGKLHTVMLTNAGELWAMGSNAEGQLGLISSIIDQPTPMEIVASGVADVATGGHHTLYIDDFRQLHATGKNTSGQLGDNTGVTKFGFISIGGATNVDVVGAGGSYSVYRQDGTTYAMGDNSSGQFGDGTFSLSLFPKAVPYVNVANAGFGESHVLFTKAEIQFIKVVGLEKVYAGEEAQFLCLAEYDNGMNEDVSDSASWGEDHALTSIAPSGRLSIGGGSEGQMVNVTATYNAFADTTTVDVVAYQPKYGTLKGLGANDFYQLGDSVDATDHLTAYTIDSDVVMVSTGSTHTFFVKTDGSLWGMGDNSYGQLGTGDSLSVTAPQMIVAADVISVACGPSHTMFVKNDGSLWGMGDQAFGKLGNKQTSGTAMTPIMAENAGVIDVACGTSHTLFLRAGGSLWAMGDNSSGQLGMSSAEVEIMDAGEIIVDDGVTAFAAGNVHSLCVRNGALLVMGENSSGQLGTGVVSPSIESPTETIPAGVVDVSSGGDFSLVLQMDGTLLGMGVNNNGELGLGYTSSAEPVPVAVDSGVVEISAGLFHSSWVTAVGALRSCGMNSNGQIGTGAPSAFVDTPYETDSGPVLNSALGGNQSLYLAPQVISLMISGPLFVAQSGTALYTAMATMSDSSVIDVSTSASWSIDTGGSFSGNTLTTSTVTDDTPAVITASYSGQVDTYDVTIVASGVILVGVRIVGPTNAPENVSTQFSCMADYSDGSSVEVTTSAVWTENSPYATIGAGDGLLTTVAIVGDWPVTITADYAGFGDSRDVMILDADPMTQIYVNTLAMGANNGTSWTDAFTELRDAYVRNRTASDTEIWVAAGTYTPTATYDRRLSFRLVSGSSLYGGFTGVESVRGDRDWFANVTVLSGDIRQPAFKGDNSHHVVVGADSAIIDGFTITDGAADVLPPELAYAPSSESEGTVEPDLAVAPMEEMAPEFAIGYDLDSVGGGLLNVGVSPQVTNCRFITNGAWYGGGAVYNRNNSATFTSCRFENNQAFKWGGAMFNTDNAMPTITNSTFLSNDAQVSGGALMNSAGASPTVGECTFKYNHAGWHGGASINNFSAISFENCVFYQNYAGKEAGAVINNDSSPTFNHCTIVKNSAVNRGGAMESNSSTVTILNSIVWNNFASEFQSLHPRFGSVVNISYSCIDDTHFTGAGMINGDPMFIDITTGVLSLNVDSPCQNTGTASSATVDIDGLPRDDGSPDMGAYEAGFMITSDDGETGGDGTTPNSTSVVSSGSDGGCALGVTGGTMLPMILLLLGMLGVRRRRES